MAISVSAKRHWWNRVGATETDTATAARVDAAVVVRGLVAACAFGAAGPPVPGWPDVGNYYLTTQARGSAVRPASTVQFLP